MKNLTLGRITNTHFSGEYQILLDLYKKLFFIGSKLTDKEIEKILSIILIFSNQDDGILKKLGYRMALAYAIKTHDLIPLYDIAINSGLIPVVALIKDLMNENDEDSFFFNIKESYFDNFKKNEMFLTEQQYHLINFYEENLNNSTAVVAPTSYGKSELIVNTIAKLKHKKICILVPSKALLAQTKKRVVDAKISWVKRVVSYPEMHRKNDIESVYILTQERLSRILNQDKELIFDLVLIDEAHNILENNGRTVLLASVIKILEFRNKKTAFKFLTPFLKDTNNLKLKKSDLKTNEFKINEYVKSELLCIADFRGEDSKFIFYDHFFNEGIGISSDYSNSLDYIKGKSLGKNIIYFNRPKHIQEFAMNFIQSLPKINSKIVNEAISEIGSSVSNQYFLLKCLERGVIYHHGSMTDPVRNYVEYLYRECPQIKYLISNSTLLEGVNLPIEKMFLLSINKGRGHLTPSQFKNLTGRVNRFSEIFGENKIFSVNRLQPEIHIVATKDYFKSTGNIVSFCEKVMKVTRKEEDKVSNILLSQTEITEDNKLDYEEAITRLDNIENGLFKDLSLPRSSTPIGLKLFENNISEIDVLLHEEKIQNILDNFTINEKIKNSDDLMRLIYDAFVSFTDVNQGNRKKTILRLHVPQAQNFYAMLLNWRIQKAPLPLMIKNMIEHWEKKGTSPVFVASWGDTTNDGEFLEHYTYMWSKSDEEKINLAIVRLKEEEDFLDYVVFRFIEILNEMGFVDEIYYKQAKYGTSDDSTIILIKNGFSCGVSELILKKYMEYITFNDGDTISISPEIHQKLIDDGIGFLQRNEVSINVAAS